MKLEYQAEPISENHDLSHFNCGNLSLNNWLRNQAIRASRQGTAKTTVLTPIGIDRVVGFYSLAPTEVNRDGLPSRVAGGVTTIPAYLLARLALDSTVQGQGLGADLLATALDDILNAAKFVSGRLLVVDAIDDAALRFYEHFGFRRIPGTKRLFRLISEIRDSKTEIRAEIK